MIDEAQIYFPKSFTEHEIYNNLAASLTTAFGIKLYITNGTARGLMLVGEKQRVNTAKLIIETLLNTRNKEVIAAISETFFKPLEIEPDNEKQIEDYMNSTYFRYQAIRRLGNVG